MKLRIIAGQYAKRKINAPRGHRTHPMSEKIRGALFNILGDIEGLTLLDAYAGSGAIAIEAISRGAKFAYAIDNDVTAYTTLGENKDFLEIGDELKITKANTISWSKNNPNLHFDIVVCDPPYDRVNTSHISQLATHVTSKGIFVLSLPPDIKPKHNKDFKFIAQKQYGDATLVFYRKTG